MTTNKRTEVITRGQAIKLLVNRKLNKFYAGTLNVSDILERCDALRLDNIPPHYSVTEIKSQYMVVSCDYDSEYDTRCYFTHTLALYAKIQGYDAVIFIFENDTRVVYLVREQLADN